MVSLFFSTNRLGLVVVITFLCLRTVVLLLGSSDHRGGSTYPSTGGSSHQLQDLHILTHELLARHACNTSLSRPSSEQIHTRHQHWQLHDTDSDRNELLVYSAFYDDREDVGSLPVLRILGVANRDHAPFYCQIWYDRMDVPYVIEAEEIKNGRGDLFGKIFYGQYMYTCKLPSAFPVPTHVSMTTRPCNTPTIFLPVTWQPLSHWKKEFAICVPISFGTVSPLELVEWMELVRLLGVSHVHVYNSTLTGDAVKVFDYYQKQGLLSVHPMPPAVSAFNKKGAKLGSPASLNDCMLRNLYTYHYLIFVDFDEVIVPKNTEQNYTGLLKAIHKRHNLREKDWMSYTFRNVYFFLDLPGDPKEPEHLKFLKYRKRMEPSGYLYAAKSFIDPRRCLSVFNHYCYIRFPLAGKHWTVDVDPALAASHHYRNCNFGKDKCNAMYKKEKKDDIMLSFKDKLHSLTEAAIKRIR